jgi:hypothetical protein
MKKFVCLDISGGDYTEKHVHVLYNQVQRHIPSVDQFIVYTDEPQKFVGTNIIVRPLVSNYRGRWAMHELFREKGHVMVTGLDTVFVRNLDKIFDIQVGSNDFYGIKPLHHQWANGVMLWNGDWAHLFYKYRNTPRPNYNLEMKWTLQKLQQEEANIKYLDNESIKIYSYKHECRNGKPDDADIIRFHGKPRPHELNNWVKNYYK